MLTVSWQRGKIDVTSLRLLHLTFIGVDVPPASVAFGERLTLIRGPSDTGKSFIVDSIDYMLGASALKEIPEREGYSTVLLGLQLPTHEVVTLSRSVKGGSIGVHEGDIRGGPFLTPPRTVSAKHNPKSQETLSAFLLSHIDLDGRRVRKNVRNETDSLSFRNVAHLCLVDETQMQAEVSPALTGNYVSRTKEISVLKLFLQAEDDSALISSPSRAESNRLSGAKLEVVDGLISDLDAQTAEAPEKEELNRQLSRLLKSLDELSGSIGDLASSRQDTVRALTDVQDQEDALRRQFAEATAFDSRLQLLLRQYDSDLARLEMINEAGSLLGYFDPGDCVFCGAQPEHQRLHDEFGGEATSFSVSIRTETNKTSALREDLVATLEDLRSQSRDLRREIAELQRRRSGLRSDLAAADQSLRPRQVTFNQISQAQAAVNRYLSLYEQMENLQSVRSRLVVEAGEEVAAAAVALNLAATREFSTEVSRRLKAWSYPDADRVRYDRKEQDLIAGDQLRSAHGKGVRAVLHAAFTTALAQYCSDRDIPHPGFVILDSPLVTYRAPDPLEDGEVGDRLDSSVAAAFYRDIETSYQGQIIVMENTNPPEELSVDTRDVPFTKSEAQGRYGFFPHGTGPT